MTKNQRMIERFGIGNRFMVFELSMIGIDGICKLLDSAICGRIRIDGTSQKIQRDETVFHPMAILTIVEDAQPVGRGVDIDPFVRADFKLSFLHGSIIPGAPYQIAELDVATNLIRESFRSEVCSQHAVGLPPIDGRLESNYRTSRHQNHFLREL